MYSGYILLVSYRQILTELARRHELDHGLLHPMDQVLLNEIIEEIPHKQILITQILFGLDQVQELMQTVYEYHGDTGHHQGRVGRLAALLAKKAKLPWVTRLECLMGGWIHDIGKIYIDSDILNKPAKLTDEEYAQMKLHVQYSADMLMHYPHLQLYSDPVLYHHERWDGHGYPYNKSGHNIPVSGRVSALADAYDAMTSLRPYADKMSHFGAIKEIKRCSGYHFDPALVHAFLQISKEEIAVLS